MAKVIVGGALESTAAANPVLLKPMMADAARNCSQFIVERYILRFPFFITTNVSLNTTTTQSDQSIRDYEIVSMPKYYPGPAATTAKKITRRHAARLTA
jgi:hypothetical protein